MAQVKKSQVRDAILRSAFDLFSTRGYANTSLPQIAKAAGTSPPNVYVYFESKFEILYTVFEPWLRRQFLELEQELLNIEEPRERLRHLFRVVFKEIPERQNGFANNIMQALSTATPEDHYQPTLINWMTARLRDMILSTLPPERRAAVDTDGLYHFFVMALDGYISYWRLSQDKGFDEATSEQLCRFLLGEP
ncbi:TetR/AcrR family transcriptional regulator [Alloalcanivorax sp. C16-2]|uniref:TetR/AcrR family transcriptional regulator n=1 Tax=Alloalcanivorax TaxID=3020832 RepID=UPI0019324D81|nr:TetR/AcrR family transcriptional regulator [Alloalcanivorax marinus]MBL7249587.1 TetR/AcrR family transcriptional regulator [Alloalcanivorax marinus]